MWSEKYLPKNTSEILGQQTALDSLKKYLSSFKKGKAALLYGPVGNGKTSSVYAIANELKKEVFEVNASDTRNKEQITSIVGSAANQQSLLSFGKGKIILVDEIDGISGQNDRGGINALSEVIENSSFPIVLTANNPFDQKFSSLRKKCVMIEFAVLNHEHIFTKLKEICDKEKIIYNEQLLRDLSRRSGGDMRASITDLELLTAEGKLLNLDLIGNRNKTDTISNALTKIFKTTNALIAKDAFLNLDEDLDKLILWLEENIPKEYEGNDLADAFDCLSKADVYLGRIRRWQHWRFLVYADALMSAGVAVSKQAKYKKMVTYKPTSRILKLYIANMKYLKRKEIAEKICLSCHCSSKRAIRDVLPYVQSMIKNKKEFKEFDFSDEEIDWLKK